MRPHQIYRRRLAYLLGLMRTDGLKNIRTIRGPGHTILLAENEAGFPILLASSGPGPGHWFAAIHPDYYVR